MDGLASQELTKLTEEFIQTDELASQELTKLTEGSFRGMN